MGHAVAPSGRVVAIEVDERLAAEASSNLSEMSCVDVRRGDGSTVDDGPFDAILVNAGVTHARTAWLDGLVTGGRIVLPLTAAMAAMGPTGKGIMVLLTKRADGDFDAQTMTFIGIYSGIGLREDAINARLGQAFMRAPFPRLKRLRRDSHEQGPNCFLHSASGCFALD